MTLAPSASLHPPDPARFAEAAGRAAKLLKALANERRLMILCQLVPGELCVTDIAAGLPAETLGGLSQSALSQHLSVLRSEGLVATRRQGTVIFYRLADPAAIELLGTLSALFCPPDGD